jgi:hypothetical protein
MPNWCYNRLSISGNKTELKLFRELAKGGGTELSLAKLYPEPDYSKIKVKPTFPSITKEVRKGEEWWDWRVQNWGTKWDIEAVLDSADESYLEYSFDSAWSPPIQWLQKIVKDFPKLLFTLKYEEEGMGFMGKAVGANGEVVDRAID